MSSNYRILVYFLKSLDSSLRIGLGLRGRSLQALIKNNSVNDLLNELSNNANNKCKSNAFVEHNKHNTRHKNSNSRRVYFQKIIHI